ncbi:PDR/VanB family oxidoreductase [Martelella alba]|nr:PDR/VanB family oxidoreductase [Martelella alba]
MKQANVFPMTVTGRRDAGGGVIILTLARPDGGPLPPFTAGAHIPLYLPGGLTRYYSLCGDPARRREYMLAVLAARPSQGGGRIIRECLLPGTGLSVGEPRNHFPLRNRPGPVLLLAGGIGITPLLPMALDLRRRGLPYRLYYAGRAETLRAFAEEPAYAAIVADIGLLSAAAADPADPIARIGANPDVDAGDGGDQPGWAGSLARTLQDWRRDGQFQLYYCGSAGFMQTVAGQCLALGLPAEDCHCESFAPPKPAGETPFAVKIRATGEIIPVGAGETIAGALRQAGIAVETSCGLGVCGTCLAAVIEGIPDHRDDYLSASEKAANDKILLCCSRARSATLVIDLEF